MITNRVRKHREILQQIREVGTGILPIFKPVGWTSFDVIKQVRPLLGIKKIGHTGTLDPFAEGLLLLCIGSATKSVPQLMDLRKTYWGIAELGTCTDSFDVTGKVTGKKAVPDLTSVEIKKTARQFIGKISQLPPMFSALKVDGKRLYSIARKGEEVTRERRTITIDTFTIKKITLPLIEFSVTCSKGTYVRSLIDDFGSALGCGAYLRMLTRTHIGNFFVHDAIHLPQLVRIAKSMQNNSI